MATQDEKFGKLTGTHGHVAHQVATNALLADAVSGNPTGITGAARIDRIVSISQANYDALATKDPNTAYYIVS